MAEWPTWWNWDFEVSPHALKRMAERDFTELDLRRMLDVAHSVDSDIVPGRWRILTRLRRRPWEIIVEPDDEAQHVVVVTAYPLSR